MLSYSKQKCPWMCKRLRLRSGDMLLRRSRLCGDRPRYIYICDTRRYVYISIEIEERRNVTEAQQAAR